ncbi:hypothetical protein T484DRAFT_1860923 [Baffinella frigidus]|nr:hypothetical protein T484DRAFT_1860923 [Cryptophyta sp. CCMP2293]
MHTRLTKATAPDALNIWPLNCISHGADIVRGSNLTEPCSTYPGHLVDLPIPEIAVFAECICENECLVGNHNCDTHANCTDTDHSFTCECDRPGYVGNGTHCDDDECVLGTDNCHETLAFCTNTDGSFTCTCDTPGYDGDGVSCDDINECTNGTDNCHVPPQPKHDVSAH